MLVIKIELWPKGESSRARLLGEGRICNEGGTFEAADYSVNLLRSPEYAKPENVGKSWRKGKVMGFPRRKLGPWDLLLRGLVSAIGERSPGDVFDAQVMLGIELDDELEARMTKKKVGGITRLHAPKDPNADPA